MPVVNQIYWPEALRSAAIGGMLLAVAMIVPFAPPFLLILGAGALAVILYTKRTQTGLTNGTGARIGATGGLLAWATLLCIFLLYLGIGGDRPVSSLRDLFQQQFANNPDPHTQQFLATLNAPGGMAAVIVTLALLFLAVALVCGAIGGAIGASLSRRHADRGRPR